MKPIRRYHENGQLWCEEWRIEGKDHRLDGPAVRYWDENGQLRTAEWRVEGGLHRVNGPAVQYWHTDGQLWYEEWWIDGRHHRIDGPAWQRWALDGKLRNEEWWIDGGKVKPIEDPLAWALFIAKTFGNVHGLKKFCLENLDEKTARAIVASSKLL